MIVSYVLFIVLSYLCMYVAASVMCRMAVDSARYWTIIIIIITTITITCGPGSSVGVATDYGLDGAGSNPGGDEIFRPSRPALEPTQPPVQWVLGLSRG